MCKQNGFVQIFFFAGFLAASPSAFSQNGESLVRQANYTFSVPSVLSGRPITANCQTQIKIVAESFSPGNSSFATAAAMLDELYQEEVILGEIQGRIDDQLMTYVRHQMGDYVAGYYLKLKEQVYNESVTRQGGRFNVNLFLESYLDPKRNPNPIFYSYAGRTPENERRALHALELKLAAKSCLPTLAFEPDHWYLPEFSALYGPEQGLVLRYEVNAEPGTDVIGQVLTDGIDLLADAGKKYLIRFFASSFRLYLQYAS